MSPGDCHNELDWSAFCYASGEMTPAEAEAFEQRLSDDQAAREALARAVEITQAVISAESLAPAVALRSQPATWSRRLAWMAIGSAASLLAALLWSGGVASWLGGRSERVSPELAAAWSETRGELSVASE